MRKTFCDHCGKEIKGVEINELGCDDCYFDDETKDFVGVGYTLCEKCLDERHRAHINLDMNFLNMVEEARMSVYIKGMEMPTSPVLFCIHPDGKVFADYEGNWREYKAVPVPPHGDLIDRDALKRRAEKGTDEHGRPCMLIKLGYVNTMPTIIPADEQFGNSEQLDRGDGE